jgi:hypothetical protein
MSGTADVASLMSHKLALRWRLPEKLISLTCIVTTRVAKTSNVSAPNCGSSSEVLAVKEMHDIGIDAVLLIYSTKFEVAR